MAVSLELNNAIPPFDPSGEPTTLKSRWNRWIRAFDLFAVGKGVEDDGQKRALLLHSAGMQVQDIFFSLAKVEELTTYDKTKKALCDYFAPQSNETYERHIFKRMAQENETVDQFVTRLRIKASACGFKDENEQVRDQLIFGLKSVSLKSKLIEKGEKLTLDDARSIARAAESSKLQAEKISNGIPGQSSEVFKVYTDKSGNPKTGQSSKDNKCFRCGREGHFSKSSSCPARNKTCSKCGLIGHFSVKCKTQPERYKKDKKQSYSKDKKGRKGQVRAVDLLQSGSGSEDEYAFTIDDKSKDEMLHVVLGNVTVPMLIDSGASTNIVDKNTWSFLKKNHIKCQSKQCEKQLYAYGTKEPLKTLGTFTCAVEVDDKRVYAEFVVIDGTGKPLLGKETAVNLGVLKIGLNVNSVSTPKDIVNNYKECFQGIGKLKDYKLKLYIDPNVKPVAQAQYRMPFTLRDKVSKELKKLEESDIIESVEGPTPWVSPMITVPKPNGDIRLCVDMRQANRAIIRERHPIPTIDEVLQEMNDSQVFSKLDLKWGYHQIELEESSRPITTFVTHQGLYRYKRLMFGISSAPEKYQQVIHQIFQDCEGVQNISDDIIVHAPSQELHDIRLKQVLNRIKERGLTLNKEKCQFNLNKLIFMGHVLSNRGINPTEDKVSAIAKARRPESAREVRSFLGLVTFCSRFIPHLATLAEPLRKLTKKNEQFKWNKEQDDAFHKVKKAIANAETLAYFDKNAKTVIIADASPVGVGAVLTQWQGDQLRPVYYASRTLSPTERRYSQTEKEALALVWACERFHLYLYGINFELVTDHKPLEVIYSRTSKPSARIQRWVLRLQPYTFTVKYRPGCENIADPLSRLLDLSKEETKSPRNVAEEYVRHIATSCVPNAVTIQEIEKISSQDEELTELRSCIKNGVWNTSSVTVPYMTVREELCVLGKIVLRGNRIVPPKKLRQKLVQIAHEGHQGMTGTKQMLRTHLWWPSMDRDVEKFCRACHGCQVVSRNFTAPEPMKVKTLPDGPWQELAIDLLGPLPTGDYVFRGSRLLQ